MKYSSMGGFGGRGVRGRGRGRFRQWSEERTSPERRQEIRAWLAGRAPAEWGVDPSEIRVDDEEVLVVVHLPAVELPGEPTQSETATAEEARIGGFREETRDRRMQIATEAEIALGRIVSWGAACGGTTRLFTTANVPVMTRLRIDERLVLDTLVDAGVARSRSEALAWCVRLVGRNEDRWIADLRQAFEHVEEVRSRGPAADS
jgi:hypothetical protein